MISVSTKKGDAGQSSVIGSKLISKDSLIFEVLGDLDELNSWLGVVVSALRHKTTKPHMLIVDHLLDVQEKLFTLSAEIAGSKKVVLKNIDLKKIETRAKKIQESLSKNWHSKFIYPGGSDMAAWTDVARSVCRRCERRIVAFSKTTTLSPLVFQYVNRLSDYLYLIRCQLNDLDDIKETKFNDVS
jgi:cob(I)alamin adenosyltransferase